MSKDWPKDIHDMHTKYGVRDAVQKFDRAKLIWLSIIISGGLAGLAGISEVSGTIGQLLPSVSPG